MLPEEAIEQNNTSFIIGFTGIITVITLLHILSTVSYWLHHDYTVSVDEAFDLTKRRAHQGCLLMTLLMLTT